MGKVLKIKAALAGAAGFAVSAAAAQTTANSQLLAQATVIEKTSASNIAETLAAMGITSAAFADGDDSVYTLLATTEGGGNFLVTIFDCADPAAGADCAGVTNYTAFSNAGLAYDDLNNFNLNASVSKAINLADQNVAIFGTQQHLNGGVTEQNMQYVTLLFLNDMQTFMDNTQAPSTSVAYQENSAAPAKTDNLSAEGAAPASAPFHGVSEAAVLRAAIANTKKVSFKVAQ